MVWNRGKVVMGYVMFHKAEIAGSEQRVSGVAPHLHFAATELFG